ncbi:hypothetical protein HF086_008605 [Spodoptera exigua]|uniref:Uncharacterized protein n=1 Tax=Spodoptera exigua TaxID=7107 RepID=A0A922M3B0_SPOEX|nr:hypothetical protein HF086_008605 [Spodoptera exigua]
MASKLLKCSSCNIVINEVLAFVCNKIDVMDEESISHICSDLENLKKASLVNNFRSTVSNVNFNKRGGFLLDSHDDYCSGPRGLEYMNSQDDISCRNNSDIRVDTSYRDMVQPCSKNEGTQQNCGRAVDNGNCLTVTGDEPETMTHLQSAAIDPSSDTGHTAAPNRQHDGVGNRKSLADIVRNGDWKIPKEDKEWTLVQKKTSEESLCC